MTAEAPVVERVRPAAWALAIEDERILLVRIAAGYRAAGRWTLPGGGLEFGEDPERGMRRELAEETGLRAGLARLAGAYSRLVEPDETANGDRVHLVGFVYEVTIAGGELRDEVDESTDGASWFALDDVLRLPVVDLVTYALSLRR